MRLIRARKAGLMVVSALLAAGLWMLVAGERTVERTMRIPLEFTNLPPRLEPIGDAPDAVDVRIRGASAALSRLSAGDLLAVMDLRQARAGSRLFHLDATDVRAPFSVEIVQVQPTSVAMAFEPTETKIVMVKPRIEGEPAPGLSIGAITSDPPTVVIAGPATAVRGLNEAITEPVSIAKATATVTDVATVGVLDPTVRVPSTRSVRVTVTLVGER
jgi:YbbR domain-containing protein